MDTKFSLIKCSELKQFHLPVYERLKSKSPALWPDVEELRMCPYYQLIRLSSRGLVLPYGMRDVPRLKGTTGRNGFNKTETGWEILSGIPRDQEVQKALALLLMDYCEFVELKQDITETDPSYHPDMESVVVTYTKDDRQELINIVCCALLDNPVISNKLTGEQLDAFEGMIL